MDSGPEKSRSQAALFFFGVAARSGIDTGHPARLSPVKRAVGCRPVGAKASKLTCVGGRYFLNSLQKERTMNFIIWLVIGGVIGWIASLIMKTDAQQGMLLNIVVGIVGAMVGGWLISPMVGVGTINQSNFSLGALIVSLIGAVILLAIVNLFRRGRVR